LLKTNGTGQFSSFLEVWGGKAQSSGRRGDNRRGKGEDRIDDQMGDRAGELPQTHPLEL